VYEVDSAWPEFMGADPVMNAFFGQIARTFPHLCAVATDASGVHCDAEHDHAVYVEPNVWVEHVLSGAGSLSVASEL
jgi:hypothetical protein